MSGLQAVVPASILRRWDAMAAAQLFEEAPQLAERVERLTQDLYWAEQPSGSCDCYTHHSDCEPMPIGLMKDGTIIRIVSAEVMA